MAFIISATLENAGAPYFSENSCAREILRSTNAPICRFLQVLIQDVGVLARDIAAPYQRESKFAHAVMTPTGRFGCPGFQEGPIEAQEVVALPLPAVFTEELTGPFGLCAPTRGST